ncbi:50S ribosomal protein L11 methyltransferase [Candidatus Woesearchaeota archaeon]|nr:50S ribosomal protein L11 methyltransferase [Candidatus Woesearchaeota archaeon]
MLTSKKSLAVELSKLKQIESTNLKLEQYQTDSELGAGILWQAYMNGDIEGCFVYDLGCGNGIFGIGSLILGAEHCIFVDVDPNAIEITNENIPKDFVGNTTVIEKNISMLDFEVNDDPRRKRNIVIMNPPFGTHDRNADKQFLEKAFKFADSIYSIHYGDSREFLEAIAKDHGFILTDVQTDIFKIKKSHPRHKKKKHEVDILIARFKKAV